MSLGESISNFYLHIKAFADETISAGNSPHISAVSINPVPTTDAQYLESFNKLKNALETDIFSATAVEFKVASIEGVSEETSAAISAFNGSVDQQSRDFALLMGFTKHSDENLRQIRKNDSGEVEKFESLPEILVSTEQVLLIEKLCILLDVLMSLATEDKYASLRSNFYTVLQHILESLAEISNDCISAFWRYVEARAQRIKDTVFNPEVTLNRISVLSLCNSLTDLLYTRNSAGKYDSYAKDSFNDVFQARVRVFLAGLLNVDDLTGLNKYFSTSNRANREPGLRTVKTGDDQLLEDVLDFYKLLRDPYTYLRNPRQLAVQADSLLKMHAYLLDEELKYLKVRPARDPFAVVPPVSETKKSQLSKKYSTKQFFPEQYWMSPFEEQKSGAEYEKVHAEDQRRALKRFDTSKFRRLLILQIYLVSCFFVELQESNKKSVLEKLGALPTTKHITEDSTPEVLVPRFLKIKRDTLRIVQTWDAQWSILLEQLALSEEHWWAWLIYGKLKEGTPLLAPRTLSDADISVTYQQFEQIYPEKAKRYFNTHATPQLSRRMKTKTGLDLLKSGTETEPAYGEEISRLTREIEAESDKSRCSELAEERTVLVWKQTRGFRNRQWHSLDKYLSTADLENEEEEEEEEEEDKKENSANGGENDNNKEHGAESKDEQQSTTPTEDGSKTTKAGSGTLNTPDAGAQSIGEIAGDHVAETRVVQNASTEKSVGEAAGESVAANRKRERSPDGASDDEAAPSKKSRANPNTKE